MKKNSNNFGKFHSQLELPFSETEEDVLVDIFKTLELKFGLKKASNQKLIDLGAGNGSIIIFAALHYCINASGIEIDHNMINEAKSRIKSLKKEHIDKKICIKKLQIKLGDFFAHSLEGYDYVYIYSLPSMHKYMKHVFKTAKKGAIIISHKYKLENFSSLLKEESTLTHYKHNTKLSTYFYKKVS